MVIDPAAHHRRGNHWLVALVEQSKWHRNDRNAEWRRRRLNRRYDAHSITARNQINAVPGISETSKARYPVPVQNRRQ
jgi:hypothetical protein